MGRGRAGHAGCAQPVDAGRVSACADRRRGVRVCDSMMNKPRTSFYVLSAVAASCALAIAAAQELPPVLRNYKPVTSQRLLKPDDSDWLMIRRTYDGWGYSPL